MEKYRHIQELFESVVKENVDEFEMCEADAVSEALQQLKAQKIDTSFVVSETNAIDYLSRCSNELAALIEQCKCDAFDNSKLDTYTGVLNKLSDYCLESLQKRCLCASFGVYESLVSLVGTASVTLSTASLHTLSNLQTRNSDLLDTRGMHKLIEVVSAPRSSEELLAALDWLCSVTELHEVNRRQFADNGLLTILVELLKRDPVHDCDLVFTRVCAVLRNFVVSDDVRVEYCDSHNRATKLIQLDVLRLILSRLRDDTDKSVVMCCLGLCARLCVRHDHCLLFVQHCPLQRLLEYFTQHIDDSTFCMRLLSLLFTLCGDESLKQNFTQTPLCTLLVELLSRNLERCNVCIAILFVVSTITLRCPEHTAKLVSAEFISPFISAMEKHSSSEKLQRVSCMVIRNMANRCDPVRQVLIDNSAEHLIRLAMSKHCGKLDFEAKQALSSLYCDVVWKEEWTGSGGALTTGIFDQPEFATF